jgi:hypothetical protein
LGCEQDRKPLSILITAGQTWPQPAVPSCCGHHQCAASRWRPAALPPRSGAGLQLKANRVSLRRHGIKATIPVKVDQAAHRRNRGGRPPTFDAEAYKQRHAVECGSNKLQQNTAP